MRAERGGGASTKVSKRWKAFCPNDLRKIDDSKQARGYPESLAEPIAPISSTGEKRVSLCSSAGVLRNRRWQESLDPVGSGLIEALRPSRSRRVRLVRFPEKKASSSTHGHQTPLTHSFDNAALARA